MEVSLVQDLNCEKGRPVYISQFSHSPVKLTTTELLVADDEPETDNCEHFTIRGYVAEVRKKDAKICWPFIKLDQHSSDEDAKSLPPLLVSKFRRWDCQDCLRKTTACRNVTGNVAVDAKRKSNNTSHGDATVASRPSGFPQLLEENSLDGRFAEADHANSGEYPATLQSGMRKTESVVKNLIKEGSQVYKGGHNNSKEDEVRSSKFPFVATKWEACHSRQKRESKKDIKTSLIDEDASIDEVYANPETNELIDDTCSEMPDEHRMSVGNNFQAFSQLQERRLSKIGKKRELNDSMIEKYVKPPEKTADGDPQTDPAAQICGHGLLHLDKSNNKESGDNICPSGNLSEIQGNANQLCSLNAKLQHKKARKVRFLNDIIRSEELWISQEINVPNVDAESRDTENDKMVEVEASKRKAQDLHSRDIPSTQKAKISLARSQKNDDSSEDEDEGPSLMNWLKKVSKKSITREKETKTKCINDAVGDISKITSGRSPGKHTDIKLEGCRTGGEHKADLNVKQHKALETESRKSYLLPQRDSITGKGNRITEGVSSQQDQTKLAGVKIIDQSPHHGLKINDRANEKAVLSKRKNRILQVQNGKSFQMLWSRGSSCTREHQNIGDFQTQERVIKKHKAIPICEVEASDDFPMDIVELLAKNQHERRLMNATAATEDWHKASEMAESREDGNHCILWDFSKGQGSKVSDAVGTSQQICHSENERDVAWATSRNTGDTDCNMKPCHSSTNAKVDHHIDLNQQQPLDASMGFHALPGFCNYPMSGVNLPITNSNRNRVEMGDSESCHNAKRNSGQNADRNTHDWFSVLLNGIPCDANAQKAYSNFSQANCGIDHVNMGSREPYFQKNLNMVSYEANNQRLINVTGATVHNRKEKAESSSMEKRMFAAPQSFVESGREHHSRIRGPSDLYTNDTIPAMHLLRLMDPTACSGEHLHASMDINCVGYIPASDFCNDQLHQLPMLKVGVKTSEVTGHPPAIANINQGHHTGDSSKPFRPLPRFGVLGSLLQKEITAHSNRCETPFGFKARYPDELQTPKLGRTQEPSHSASHAIIMNSQACDPRHAESLLHHGCSMQRDNMARFGINSKDGEVQPMNSSWKMEICMVNRNPADFAIVDEDCEYMIGSHSVRPRFVSHSGGLGSSRDQVAWKKQKVTALKGLMRS